MICPHCKKPVQYKKSDKLKDRALELLTEGYSTRDVETVLERQVSFGTIARWARELKSDHSK